MTGLVLILVVVVAALVGVLGGLYFLPEQSTNDPLLVEFAQLKKQRSPRANALLAQLPEVPQQPVTPAEAERLDAQFILHSVFKVKTIDRVDPPARHVWPHPRFVLALEGGVASEKFTVRTPDGRLEHGQRFLNNPDVVVEVHDGKIYGLYARLHHEGKE